MQRAILHLIVPVAIAAAFLAASARAADPAHGSDKAKAKADATIASERSASGADAAVQNHAQGDVQPDCLREDARKHPADVPCSKLKSMHHPKEHKPAS